MADKWVVELNDATTSPKIVVTRVSGRSCPFDKIVYKLRYDFHANRKGNEFKLLDPLPLKYGFPLIVCLYPVEEESSSAIQSSSSISGN